MMRKWYHRTEQWERILTEWQQLRLYEEMSKRPYESEVAVFRWFVARFITLQKQIYSKYQGDGYLVDRLLTTVDIPEIQASLKDRMPRNAQTAIHRISTQLSAKPRTVGEVSVQLVSENTEYTIDGQDLENGAL